MKKQSKEILNQLLASVTDEEETISSFKELSDTIVDQNEELIATYVEGTQRTIKASKANSETLNKNTTAVNTLSRSLLAQAEQTKQSLGAVERAVKAQNLSVDTSKVENSLVEMEKALKAIKIPKSAKDAIPVRLSNGKEFIKSLAGATASNLIVGGGGGSKQAFSTQVSPNTALIDTDGHVQVDIVTIPAISVSGSDGAIVDGANSSLKATVLDLTSANPLTVAITDGNGDQITSFGGGTQYTEGDTDASITGTAMLMEVAANTLQPVQGTVAAGLLVNLGTNNDVTVTGTVAVTQSGTWDEVGINDSGNVITVDGSGTAGTAATGVITVQGIASMTPIQVGDNSSSLSVDWNGTTPVTGSGTATGALRVELPTNGTGVVGLNAGTNAIGKLAANSGVDIGDVDVTSVIAGTGATNLGKAEDAGHTTGDTGVYNLGVRNDTPNTALTNTDADYASITTDRVGGIRTALYETDFAVLGTNHVKKYYTNSGAVTDGIVWSPAAGKRWYVTDIFINVSAAATVTLEDDLGAGDSPVWKAELAANSGWSHHYGTPLFSGEDAADLIVTTSAGNVYITITGYEI